MRFLIQNTTNEPKSIVRFGGGIVVIPVNDFFILDSDNPSECSYWATVNKNNSVAGLNVIINNAKIRLYSKLKEQGKYEDVVLNKTTNTNVNDAVEVKTNDVTEIKEVVTDTVEETAIDEVASDVIVEEPTVEENTTNIEVEPTAEVVDVVTTEPETIEQEITEPVTIVEVEEPVELTDEVDAEPITEELEEVDEINEQVEESTETKLAYTEEELSAMSKEELQEICTTYGISFRKNNSISTLVGLIMEYQTNEE